MPSCAVVTLVVALTSLPALATEGGATNKILGADTVLSGVMGPPGSLLSLSFVTYYHADKTVDGAGDPRPGISNFDVNVMAVSTRLGYVWPDAKFLGADIETRVGIPFYVNANVSFDVQTPSGPAHRESGAGDSFPGVLIAPAILGWHSDTVHQMATVEAFLSTREYRTGQIANVATGFNSLAPAYWVTWFPDPKIEVDGSVAYLFNGKNHTTGYKSGQEFSMDYAAGYNLTPGWQVGANGYVYQQTTDDTLNGSVVADGNRGRVFAIGPYVRYREGSKWGVTFKWQIESLAENRPVGNRFFLHFGIRLW